MWHALWTGSVMKIHNSCLSVFCRNIRSVIGIYIVLKRVKRKHLLHKPNLSLIECVQCCRVIYFDLTFLICLSNTFCVGIICFVTCLLTLLLLCLKSIKVSYFSVICGLKKQFWHRICQPFVIDSCPSPQWGCVSLSLRDTYL